MLYFYITHPRPCPGKQYQLSFAGLGLLGKGHIHWLMRLIESKHFDQFGRRHEMQKTKKFVCHMPEFMRMSYNLLVLLVKMQLAFLWHHVDLHGTVSDDVISGEHVTSVWGRWRHGIDVV